MSEISVGQIRQPIFSVQSYAAVGSVGLAAQDCKLYRRFTGAISVVGSATFRWQMGPTSGQILVSSSIIVNSGIVGIIDVLNVGRWADFGFTAINSQPNVTAYLLGDSQR